MFFLNLIKKTIHSDNSSGKGSILIFTLWIVLILTLFALGLAYKARVEVKSVSYGVDELKLHYITKSAVNWIVQKLKSGQKDFELNEYINLGQGKFKIVNIKDEESKININEVPEEVLAEVLGSELAKKIDTKGRFFNLESLMLVEGMIKEEESEEDEENLRKMYDNLLTVYGDKSINFNTTNYYLLDKFKKLPKISDSNLKSQLCNWINGLGYGCCNEGHCSESILINIVRSSKINVFNVMREIKERGKIYLNKSNLKKDLLSETKDRGENIEDSLSYCLKECCIANTGSDCTNWADSSAESLIQDLLEKIIDNVMEYIDVKSSNYRVDIVSEIQDIQKGVSVVVDISKVDNNVRYWYSHYYKKYED